VSSFDAWIHMHLPRGTYPASTWGECSTHLDVSIIGRQSSKTFGDQAALGSALGSSQSKGRSSVVSTALQTCPVRQLPSMCRAALGKPLSLLQAGDGGMFPSAYWSAKPSQWSTQSWRLGVRMYGWFQQGSRGPGLVARLGSNGCP
jgi:hypothetical protein